MQTPIYIVKNQHGQFISKQKEWLDGSEPKLLFRTKHHDEALNLVFELSLKDIELRASHEICELDDKGQPIVEVTYQPPLVFDEESLRQEKNQDTDEAENSVQNELSENTEETPISEDLNTTEQE